MNRLYIGQGQDLFWTFNNQDPTLQEYLSMVDYSTLMFLQYVRYVFLQLSSPHRNGCAFQPATQTHGYQVTNDVAVFYP